jgi:hypothetical protein
VRSRGGKAILCSFLMASSAAALAGDTADVPVSVRIGSGQVRLNVRLHIASAITGLPKPGELPITDPHERAHDARTYCYRYVGRGRPLLLELFDSTFGLHTARISVAQRLRGQCPTLSHEPVVVIGETEYKISSDAFRPPAGYTVSETPDSLTISRHWTYSRPPEPTQRGACFSREVSLTIEPPAGTPRSLMVQNWEEPGC